MNCMICNTAMDPALTSNFHPTCITFAEPGDEDSFTVLLKTKLTEMIEAQERRNPRSQQVRIGPSEIGDPCDRRIGYRLAQLPEINELDPLPAIVGTAVHTWLEAAVTEWMKEKNTADWSIEKTLVIDEFIEGHSDLYSHELHTVIDWKTMGPTVIKKTREHGPAPGYVIQAHVYGYGYEQAGYPVKNVALACLPRAGWLRDMFLWVAPYDRSIAEFALNRVYSIAQQIMTLDVLKESHGYRWEQVPATPSNDCGMCPYYDPGRDLDRGADERGCPGR